MNEDRFYTIEEIKEILKSEEKLVYIDDGIDEFAIKYKDLPDAIVELNTIDGMRDLKVYEYGQNSMTPIITTLGIFLDKCDSEVRKDIIDRLIELQKNIEKPKIYKIIDEDYLEEARKQLAKEETIQVIYKEVGKDPVVKEIQNTLEAKQELVNGLIEVVPYNEDEDLVLICNEEGKIQNLELNIDMGFDYIVGNCLVVGDDYINGDFKSVPNDKVKGVIEDLKERAVIVDKFMSRNKNNEKNIKDEKEIKNKSDKEVR